MSITKKEDPLLSIIMPVKNAAPFLGECLESIYSQSFTGWELIVVDDHSEDESVNLLKSYATKDKRIQLYANSGKGIIPALQLALTKAKGIFLSRMDADDVMPEERLQKMLKALEKSPPKTIVTGLVKYFSSKKISHGYRGYQQWLNGLALENRHWANIYRECVIASPNWMTRRNELIQASCFDDLVYPEDYHLVFRWYQSGFSVKTIPETTLLWREHPDRTSRNSTHYAQRAFFELKINEFIRYELQSDQLVIWGKGKKTSLTTAILKDRNIPFTHMSLQQAIPSDRPVIKHYREIEHLKNFKLLLAVYPPAEERVRMENYLNSIGLTEGKNYWYL